ncbi:hypothetical protein SY88_17300 [Clostridiales bacterium PH28_bin88]|nr:hypothetical protein SY88_17300 [Clostridiales bacterium PH28_bin88]
MFLQFKWQRSLPGLVVLLLALVLAVPVCASWVYFSVPELINTADLIVIGEIGEVISERPSGSGWESDWDVRVVAYVNKPLPGDKIIVSTPGALNKNVMSPSDYRLDQWGKDVLLFLKKTEGGRYSPITPAGVVQLAGGKVADEKISAEAEEQLEAFFSTARLYPPGEQNNTSSGWVRVFQVINFAVIILAVTSGMLVWRDAKNLGYQCVLWALASLVFFPIGLVGYLLYRRGRVSHQ